MASRSTAKPTDITFYEGLIRKTASMYVLYVDEEFEDIVSIFRIKVWRALAAYDPSRSRMPVERYVFSCVKNQAKDLLKRRRRTDVYIADQSFDDGAEDSFERQYLAVSADEVYELAEEGPPLIPSTLTDVERQVVGLLYLTYSQRESADRLGLTRPQMERAMRSIRVKMADWAPPVPVPVAA